MLENPLESLADLLTKAGLAPVVAKDGIVPSTVYDLQYRIAIIACAFMISEHSLGPSRRLRAGELKLVQFVAVRPWLIEVLRSWSGAQKKTQQELFPVERLRRGFLSDTMHDDTMQMLVALRVIRRVDNHVLRGERFDFMQNIYQRVSDDGLFRRERETLQMLSDISITERMLEGW